MRDVRRNGGRRGLCGGPGKRVDGVFPGRPHSKLSASTSTSGRLQPRTRGNGAERQNKVRNSGMVCPNVTGRTKERLAQSKRARGGSLTLVDKPQVARTCILRAFGLQIEMP